MGLRWTGAFPKNGSLAIFPPGCGPQPHLDWPFIAVAYYLLAISRLGCSPKLGFDATYHTTFYKFQGKTNPFLDKKSRRFPASSPTARHGRAPAFICPGARQQLFPQSWKQCHVAAQEFPTLTDFIIARYKRRTKYMSNLIYPLPPLAKTPPRPPSEPCGALAAEPCLAPVPAVPGPSTPSAAPRPEKPPSDPPAPLPSARCSVKGCVFPVPLQGHTKCHYHELLQSEGELFESHQPSQLLSLHAPFGIPDDEPDDSRHQDRKRRAAEREAFILDETA